MVIIKKDYHVFIMAVLLILLLAVAGKGQDSQSVDKPVEATLNDRSFIEDGTVMVSPVSGKNITKNSQTPSLVYRDKLYFFCCRVDMKKFMTDPEIFAELVFPPNGKDIKNLRKVNTSKKGSDDKIYEINIGTSPSRGPVDAPVTIVMFMDFECPFSVREAPKIESILKDYPDQVRVVFKHFPLRFHEKAKACHAAAELAHLEGGPKVFWQMYDLIISNPQNLEVDNLREYAELLELNLAVFDELMLDQNMMTELLKADHFEARKCKVRGTPTVFINGQKLTNRTISDYKEHIDQILTEVTKKNGITKASEKK